MQKERSVRKADGVAILLVIISKWNFVGGIAWTEKQDEGRTCWKASRERPGIWRACEVRWGGGGGWSSAEGQACGKQWCWSSNHRDQLSEAAPFWFHSLWPLGLVYPLEFLLSSLVAGSRGGVTRGLLLCAMGEEEENKAPGSQNCPRGAERPGELQYPQEDLQFASTSCDVGFLENLYHCL